MEPKLTGLLSLIEEQSALRALTSELQVPKSLARRVIPDAAKPYLIAALYHHLHRPLLILTARPEVAKNLYEQVANWSGSNAVNCFLNRTLYPTSG